MLVFVGLGNPGKEYQLNRHNIGFLVVDKLLEIFNFQAFTKKYNSMFSCGVFNGVKVCLIKPQTYMNLSGNGVAPFFQFFKLNQNNLCVIHDDLDLDEFRIKTKQGGGNAGHNGLSHISKTIGNDYFRIRIGIGRPTDNQEVKNYVLSDFKDKDDLNNCILTISKNIESSILKYNNCNFFEKEFFNWY